MAGLPDIAPSTRTVTVRGVDVQVPGADLAAIGGLIYRFQALADLFEGEVDVSSLMAQSQDVVAAVIAAGLGCYGDSEQEEKAKALNALEQAELLEAILAATLPDAEGNGIARLLAVVERTAALLTGDEGSQRSPST